MSVLMDIMGAPHSRRKKRSNNINNSPYIPLKMRTNPLEVPVGDSLRSMGNSSRVGILASSHSCSFMSSSSPYSTSLTPVQYFIFLLDFSQMDIQSALDQMKSLLSFSPSQTQKVYKLAYYRKQTKNHWARDDPAFISLQVVLLLLSSISYCIAFRSENMISSSLNFAFQSIFVNFLGCGVVVASLGRSISNAHLTVQNSAAHVRQGVEWLYAFDIHCNAFFPLFSLLYGFHFFLLPFVLGRGLVPFILSNTLFSFAFIWYFYVTHLGYRALPFLSNTEIFLFPIAGVVLIYILNMVGYPFGFGWNASRILANIYFEV